MARKNSRIMFVKNLEQFVNIKATWSHSVYENALIYQFLIFNINSKNPEL